MQPEHLVIIGSSAGGPRILRDIFKELPRLNASIILVQHMPEFINNSFCRNLDMLTDMRVSLAESGEKIQAGNVYVAPSGKHLVLKDNRRIVLSEGEKVNYVCPSVDVTMLSLQKQTDIDYYGVILTGMGSDGMEGIQHIKDIGGKTIAQDESTSIIFGMPRMAIETGKVDFVLPAQEIPQKLRSFVGILPG